MTKESKYDKIIRNVAVWDHATSTEVQMNLSLRGIIGANGIRQDSYLEATAIILNDMMDFMDEHQQLLEDLKKSIPINKKPGA